MTITSVPMSVHAGHEYDRWILRLEVGLKELIAEGTAPEFLGLDKFLKLSDRLRAAVRAGADNALRDGRPTFTVSVPFTEAEHRTLSDMGTSLLSYLEILTISGKIDATPSAGVQEAIDAMAAVESADVAIAQ
jgi:hypothetical protein